MKKIILSAGFLLASFAFSAQIKIYPSGSNVVIGATPGSTPTAFKLQVIGNSAFSATTSTITSSAMIRGNNAYSEATTTNGKGPDFTWFYDDNTGFFHPTYQVIGFSIGGTEKMRLHSNGFLGIGTTSPSSQLSVGGSGNSVYTGYLYNSSTSNGVVGLFAAAATPTTGSYGAYGIKGYLTSGTGYVYGISGSSYNGTGLSGRAFGVYGQAGGSTDGYNCGIYGQLLGNMLGTGVYGADASNSTQQNVPGQFAGYFAGKIRTTNDVPEKPTGGSWTGYSDIRLKKDTAGYTDGLSVLRKIHPITYKFTGAGKLPAQKTYIGVSAQQMETILPACVGTGSLIVTQSESSAFGPDVISALPADSSGISYAMVRAKTFSYDPLIYLMINCIKQLDSANTALERQVAELQSGNLKINPNTTNTLPENSSEERKISTGAVNPAKLWQNTPNPFNQTTVIKCFIPEESKTASILIFDLAGALRKTVPVSGKGEVNVTINAKELVAGMYHYSLIIDGLEIDTKKMILTE